MHASPRPWPLAHLSRLMLVALLALAGVQACADDPGPGTAADITDGNNAADNNATNNANNANNASNNANNAAPDDVGPDVPVEDTGDDAAEDPDIIRPDVDRPDTDRPDVDTPDADPADADADLPDVVEEGFLRILSVEPAAGPLEGGTEVLIGLEGEPEQPRVYFAGREATEVRRVGRATLFALTPPGAAGPADVKIIDLNAEDTLVDGFRYYAPLEITAISPARSATDGGALIQLRGESFEEGVQVSFGGRAAIDAHLVDAQTIVAFTPPHAAGRVDVRVTNAFGAAVLPGALEYFDQARLDQVIPGSGPAAGGNTVVLQGAGFTADAQVRFGGVPAPSVRLVTGERLEVTVPPGSVGPANVEVLGANGSAGLVGGYRYLDAAPEGIALYAVIPNQGPAAGGQEVVIHGHDLDADDLEISFGSARATLIEVMDTAVRVRTPAGSPGLVDVRVRNSRGESTLANGWRYLQTLALTNVSPGEGPVAGGTRIVVDGAGFTAGTRFRVGPLEATEVTLDGPNRATMVTPPGSLGWATLRASTAEQTAALPQGFRYTDATAVTGIHPVRGSIAGGTWLTIYGYGFDGDLAAQLGRESCNDVQLIDQATIACSTPPGREGAVEVKVNVSGQELIAPQRYLYYHPASQFGGAWGEDVDGAVNVSVFSIDGSPVDGAFVMLTVDGDTQHQGFTNPGGLITFSGPDVLGEQFVSATAPLFSSATVQSVNAENVTILLFPTVPPQGGGGGGGIPLATITGQVSGFQKIGEPGEGERQIIIVETTRESPWQSNPWPGNGNVVDPNGDRTYTLQSRIGDIAVVAIGGLINDRTGKFTPYAYGIARYLFVSQDNVYEINIELEHDLDQVMTFKLNGSAFNATTGPTVNRVTPWVDLGFEGVFGGWDVAEGTESTIAARHQAPLEGPLADAAYYLHGGAFTGLGSPYSVAVMSNVTSIDGLIELPTLIGTPQPLVPANNGVAFDHYVAFQPLNNELPDFWQIQLYQLPNTQVWEVTIPGTQTWFQLPDFPDFSTLPFEDRPNPYGAIGPLYMIITGARIQGFDYNQHEYLNDLRRRDRWESWTRTGYYVTIPP